MTLDEAIKVTTEADADAFVASAVAEQLTRDARTNVDAAAATVRANVAYHAGYYGHDVRLRVERLYKVVHPILGSAETPPTADQAFALGILNAHGGEPRPLDDGDLARIVDAAFPPTGYRLRRDGGKGEPLAWLSARPAYCDRGRWHAGYDVGFWRSDVDNGVRYYFDVAAAKSETEAYLRAKGHDTAGAAWIVEYRAGVGREP